MVLTNDTSSFAISSVSSVSFTEKSSIVSVFTPNSIDFVPAVLATHRLGGIVSASNPQLTSKELAFQLETSKARALIIGQDVLETGLEAAKLAGIPLERCAVVQTLAQIKASKKASKTPSGLWTIHGLLSEGFSAIKRSSSELSKGQVHLKKGEGKSQLSFLLFSSGTTGLPKGVSIQHSAPISNVLQVHAFNNVGNKVWKEGDGPSRLRPGKDVSLGGEWVLCLFSLRGTGKFRGKKRNEEKEEGGDSDFLFSTSSFSNCQD